MCLRVGWGPGGPWASGKGLCVLFIQVFPRPARVSLRHVCIHKGTHSDFTLHSSLEFGGSTTISPKSSPRLCAPDPQLGSHPLAHPAPRLPFSTFCRDMEPTCGRTHTAAAALWRVTWPCFRLAWGPRPVAWADSVLERLLLSGISSSSSSSFFCQRLLQVHAAHLPFSIGEAPPQQTHVAETLALG